MIHYLYCIENLINGKIYVGKHSTTDMNDGYMGSGKALLHAIKKYGVENFQKHVLITFQSSEDAFKFERQIVNEEFINDDNTYNIRVGGMGGFDWINRSGIDKFKHKRHSIETKRIISEKAKLRVVSDVTRQKIKDGLTVEGRKRISETSKRTNTGRWRSLSQSVREKISKTLKIKLPAIAKFTHEQADDIRKQLALGKSISELAKELNVSRHLISRIKHNQSYVRP